MNDISKIISQLQQQRASIDRAISALREIGGSSPSEAAAPAKRKKRHISPEGRKRIIEATKRRWAAKRAADAAAQKSSGRKAAGKKSA